MKIVIAGGTGFLGSRLTGALAARGHALVVLTRNPDRGSRDGSPSVRPLQWDARSVGPWAAEVDGADAVINLVGESIAGWRWTAKKKQRILESRVKATDALVGAVRSARVRPSVFINASAVNYYDPSAPGTLTESSPPGSGFLSEVTRAWEQAASPVVDLGVRLVLLRTGIVLDASQGALPRLLLAFRLYLGGPLGSGQQWFPWIHPDDVLGITSAALERKDLAGPLNLTAPGSVTMDDFCAVLGRVLNRPSWLPVPAILLRLLLGEMSVLVLKGACVVPRKLLDSAYRFRYPLLEGALRDLLRGRES